MNAGVAIIGRQEVLAGCQDHLAAGRGVLLYGTAGIGKSTVINSLVEASDAVVLSASPVAGEAHLPYVALFDLFRDFLDTADRMLPSYLVRAIRGALLHHSQASTEAVHQLSLCIAVVELLRAIAADQPVLLVIDDAQWLDPSSVEVIAFAARRLSGAPVATLIAERVADGGEPRLATLSREPVLEVGLGGLPEADLAVMLRGRLDGRLEGANLSRVTAASDGNPLYALELGRSLLRRDGGLRPGEPVDVPRQLRDLLGDRLSGFTTGQRAMLLMLAAGGTAPEGPELSAAMAAGVLVRGVDGRARFSHPLLLELVYADATGAQRRAAHARIAELTDDPVRHARHRALATDVPDAGLAEALDKAAQTARRRGAPGMAAELSRLAAERTPDDLILSAARMLDAAHSSHTAGLFAQARADCERALPDADVAGRVAARLLLADLDPDPNSEPAGRLLRDAAADAAGDPHLTARVHLYRADMAMRSGNVTGCLALLRQAEALAADDPEIMLQICSLRGPIELFTDGGRAMRTYEKGIRIAAGRPLTEAAVYVRAGVAVAQLRQGLVSDAVEGLELLRGDVEQAGRLHELGDVLHVLTGAYERAGRCPQAYTVGIAGARLREDHEPNAGRALLLRGMAELSGGTAAAAAEVLEAAVAVLEPLHMTESGAFAHGLLGRARLLLGDLNAAAALFGRSRDLLDRMGYNDPGLFLLDADLVESLARIGAHDQASRALAVARDCARRPDRSVMGLSLDRAAAVLESVTGNAQDGALLLGQALDRHAGHPYPLEVARGWLALGGIEARARRRAAARKAFHEAARRYAVHGCRPWLSYTQKAIADLDRRDQSNLDIEERIITMVRAGATNRQIAVTLHMSIKTVEAHLTRIYRSRGVRGRAELIAPPGVG